VYNRVKLVIKPTATRKELMMTWYKIERTVSYTISGSPYFDGFYEVWEMEGTIKVDFIGLFSSFDAAKRVAK